MASVEQFKNRYQLLALYADVEQLPLSNSLTIRAEKSRLIKEIELALSGTQPPADYFYFRVYSLSLENYEKKFKELNDLQTQLSKSNFVESQSGPHFNPKDESNIPMFSLVMATKADALDHIKKNYRVETITQDLFVSLRKQPNFVPESDYNYVIIRKYSIAQSEAVTFLNRLKKRKQSAINHYPLTTLSGPYCENIEGNGAPFLYLRVPKSLISTIKEALFDTEDISWQVQQGNTLNPALKEMNEIPPRDWGYPYPI